MLKTIGCGELRAEHAGEQVTLAGWVHRRRDHGGLIFLDLRDSTGLVQVVAHPEDAGFGAAENVRSEYVIQVQGEVSRRKDGTENAELPTGDVEVRITSLRVLNEAETPPFPVNQDTDVAEATRLRYRYLDLRRERMQRNLRLRHRVVQGIRNFMSSRGFIEVETPVLGLATPEGARDYLVPSRVHPGSFYALPQSPQQWKQLLMVAGVDRYFQIARCYRDEDLRADRQPEFTQLDLEMAFVEQEDILQLTEDLYHHLSDEVGGFNVPEHFPRLTYAEAMERFGSDKPDLRYGMEITDLTNDVHGTEFQVFNRVIEDGGRIRAICVEGGADISRRGLDALTELARENGASGLVWVQFTPSDSQEGGPLDGITADDVKTPVSRFFSPEDLAGLGKSCGAKRGDLLLIAAGADAMTSRVLDVLRRQLADERGLADPDTLSFLFVTEFPMFEYDEDNERWSAVHHLFTSPFTDDLGIVESDPGAVRSHAYDLVCNGQEVASGSIRIHSRDVQMSVLRALGLSMDEAMLKFGHMLEAFTYGAPPHGGIAPGIDRTVALFARERDIREVIAFPKTKTASDLLMGAPAAVTTDQLREVHVELDPVAKEHLAKQAEGGEEEAEA
ncbi:MAG: aspartate--tRNA ligase [Dehalococcoidia bacterium]|nr:aspartate--tRNA ligase [Dehalococcoidia bacterium]